MSAKSPFREDLELAESMETVWPASEEALEEDETWYPREPAQAPFAEAVAAEPEAEEPWEEEEGEEEFDFAEAEEETAHPILAVFPLPAAVLEALSGGLSSLAVGLAAGAGYRDVNQLTNIVFYFRHPDKIGHKIRPEERDLAAEWISIRDRIVKPALESPSAPGAPFVPAAPAAVGAPAVTPDSLSSSRLEWPGAKSAEEMAFMRAVYDRHAARSKASGAGFVMDLPKAVVGPIERGHVARKDTAQAVRALLEEARAAIAVERPNAWIGIVSAYRPATKQFEIWQGRNFDGTDRGGGFPHYYRKAIRERVIREGDFGPDAVEKMVAYQGRCIASPGYSNHQDGLAIDFGVGLVGKGLGKIASGSWFHRWLKANARRFGFHPLASEAWHWTYHPPAGQSEIWSSEVAPTAVRASRVEVRRVPMLARHRGNPPDLILRWNDMPVVPEEIDVVVHLHGFWYAGMKLPRDIEPVSGLELASADGADGQRRTRPTLTVLPRAHNTGVKQTNGPYYAYTFPALVTKNGLTDLVRVSLERFAAETGGAAPRVGRLIVTAHSGGGKALLQILRHHDPHQVHVFDALYWPPDALVDWARRRIRRDRAALQAGGAPLREYMSTQGGALRVFYQDRTKRGTRPNSLALRTAISTELGDGLESWYRVEASKHDHFQIPRLYGRRVLVDASADVPDAYVEQTARRKELEDGFEEGEYEDLFGEDELEEMSEAPLNDFTEPVSRTRHGESVEPESEVELWADDEEQEEHDDTEFLDEAEEDLEFAVPGTFGEEETYPELEEGDEWGRESPEVELGEVEAFLEALDSRELAVDQETAATVTFPSGASLRVVPGPTAPGEEHHDPNGTGNPLLDTSESVRSTRLSTNFTAGELARSGGKTFDKARIDPELVRCLQKLRDRVGKPVRVTSSYRPYLYNDDLYRNKYGKKPTLSRHSSGQAADVKVAGMNGMEIAKAAIDACGGDIGVGIGGDYAHVDVRWKWARWTYFENDKERNDRAVAEIDAYRRRSADAGVTTPHVPSTAGAAAGVRLRQVKGKGWAAYGGGRLEETLRRLVQSGSLSISERDIDTLQRIADVESSGLTNALNSWDNAVMSIAFKQWTLRWGELQDLISRAPDAFARHGIRLAPSGTNYVFGSKGKTWTQRAIDGVPDKETLRNEDWGRRFYLAGLEPEAVVAAAQKALEDVAKLERNVRTKYGWSPHLDSPRGRALLAELDNNRPAYVKEAVERTLAREKERPGLDENAFLEIFAAEIAAAYERRENDAEKGRRWTRKIVGG